jgi:hypothetical protein
MAEAILRLSQTPNPTKYHFHLVCPRCGKTSEHVSDQRIPSSKVNCGDCLMEAVEIVQMKVV